MRQYRYEGVIQAPQAQIWNVLSDPARWPEWMPGLARVEGEGNELTARRRGIPLQEKISISDETRPCERLVFTRSLPGMTVKNTYELLENPAGGTKVIRSIETSGPVSRGFGWIPGFKPSESAYKASFARLENLAGGIW